MNKQKIRLIAEAILLGNSSLGISKMYNPTPQEFFAGWKLKNKMEKMGVVLD